MKSEYTQRKEKAMEDWERGMLEYQLSLYGWNVMRTARNLGLDRSNLIRKLKKLGFVRPGKK